MNSKAFGSSLARKIDGKQPEISNAQSASEKWKRKDNGDGMIVRSSSARTDSEYVEPGGDGEL